MNTLVAIALIMAVGCTGPNGRDVLAIEAQGFSAMESRALEEQWDELSAIYAESARDSFLARSEMQESARAFRRASSRLVEAGERADDAIGMWKLYQQLLVVAATVDAANFDAASTTPSIDHDEVSCDAGMSPARHRALEARRGAIPPGNDVDHIVPKSLGGADHPLNYQWLPASENRSLGNAWGLEKCMAVGMVRCFAAIAVSVKCGSFRFNGF